MLLNQLVIIASQFINVERNRFQNCYNDAFFNETLKYEMSINEILTHYPFVLVVSIFSLKLR